MVFRTFLASVLFLAQTRSMAQIDELKTSKEVLNFVSRVASCHGQLSSKMGFGLISQSSFDSLVKRYHLQSFETDDLDGNGMTDLIFNGSARYSLQNQSTNPLSLAILSFGKDSFYVRKLSLDFFEDVAGHIIHLDGKPYIQTIRVTSASNGVAYYIDTLAWQFNAFIEKEPPANKKITQIDYNASNGLAFWTNMTLRIINDTVRLTKSRIEGFNDLNRGGIFLARVDNNTRQRLYSLLDAINFSQLKDSYSIDARDADFCALKITYDNGLTKTITDYGACGTYGLAQLHQLLMGLPETQHWVNADPQMPRQIDSLHTDHEVLGLIRTLGDDYPFLDFEPDSTVEAIPDYRERLAAFGEQRWQKADFDGNGYTDLLFNGYLNKDGRSKQYSIVVLSFGDDSLLVQELSGANAFFAARLIRFAGHDDIQISLCDAIEDSSKNKKYRLAERMDTLIAYDGQIFELPAQELHHTEKLKVREKIGDDSIVLTRDTLYWYSNDAPYPQMTGDTLPPRKDSINLYVLEDAKTCQNLLEFAAGIRFDRLNPDLLLPNKNIRDFGATWYVEYDEGKKYKFISDGGNGSYRLAALESKLFDLKHDRPDWKLMSPIHIQQPIR